MKTLLEQRDEVNLKIAELNQKIIIKDEEIKGGNYVRCQMPGGQYVDKRVDVAYMTKQRCYLASLKTEKEKLVSLAVHLSRELKKGGAKLLADHFLQVARLTLTTEQFDFILRQAITLTKDGGKSEDLIKHQVDK